MEAVVTAAAVPAEEDTPVAVAEAVEVTPVEEAAEPADKMKQVTKRPPVFMFARELTEAI